MELKNGINVQLLTREHHPNPIPPSPSENR
jgi:hypothetical protein